MRTLFFVLLAASTCLAQTAPQIEAFPPVDALRLLNGLGWNVAVDHEWEFAKVHEAHGKEARFQFNWDTVENMSGALQLPPKFQDALRWCAKYQLEPMIVAAYGPPRAALETLTVTKDVPAGAYTLPVAGKLDALDIPSCHVLREDHIQLVADGKWAYYGALITAVDSTAGTLTLAAKTKAAISAGTKLTVNRLRYPSVPTEDPLDPSTQAYVRYAHFLAEQIAAFKLKGRVEIWNEPPWVHDPWDRRRSFYDSPPPELSQNSPNWGILRALLADKNLPAGVRYTWGGSHKSGARGLLSFPAPGPSQEQAAATVSSEGWHPYGPSPEYNAWRSDLLASAHDVFTTGLEGTNQGSNFKLGRRKAYDHLQKFGWTVPEQVSEAGFATSDQLGKARWVTRFFVAWMALGPRPQLERIDFYRLAEAPAGYAMIDGATKAELPAYIALKGLMEDLTALRAPPISYTQGDLPTAQLASPASFPLVTIPIIGRRATSETGNTILFVCYQRTFASKDTEWLALNPQAVPVKISLPPNTEIKSTRNLVTRKPVEVTSTGVTATVSIAADPVIVSISPK